MASFRTLLVNEPYRPQRAKTAGKRPEAPDYYPHMILTVHYNLSRPAGWSASPVRCISCGAGVPACRWLAVRVQYAKSKMTDRDTHPRPAPKTSQTARVPDGSRPKQNGSEGSQLESRWTCKCIHANADRRR
jgi:hypothetical protein